MTPLLRCALFLLWPAGLAPAAAPPPAVTAPRATFGLPLDRLQERLPPPPGQGSLEEEADLEAVRQAQTWRSPAQETWARRVDRCDIFDLLDILGPDFKAKSLPRTARLLEAVLEETRGLSRELKRRHARPRPPQVDPAIRPCVPLPASPAYPSGHAFSIALQFGVVAEILPEARDLIQAQARRATWGRVLAGVHYPTDLEGSRILAEAVLTELRLNRAFRKAVAACRAEVAPLLARKAA